MSKVKLGDAWETCNLLIKQRRWGKITHVLKMIWPKLHESDDWLMMLALLEDIPRTERVESLDLSLMYTRTLAMNSCNKELLDFSAEVIARHGLVNASGVAVHRSGTLFELGLFDEAREVLDNAIPHLEGDLLGIAFSRLGLVLYSLKQAWHEAFVKARGLLTGEELGKALLNEGYCLSQSGESSKARDVWLEALPLFRSNPRMLAWIRFNLGVSSLRDLDPQAERHFLEAERLTHKPQAVSIRSRVLSGLAGWRRALGEWSRAESGYREALHLASDTHDRKEAHFGIARTLRLAGRHVEALEVLEFALADHTLEPSLFHVARANNYLALGQPQGARESLARVGALVSEYDKWLERIARAELARQDGRLEEAVQLLDGLPVDSLHAREEAGAFPLLFKLLESAGKPVPKPLEYIKGLTVQVRALGVLRVMVNGREVPIAPTGRIGELLVFLLEQGGEASLEVIGEAFYGSEASRPKSLRQSVWKLVNGLRDALGWQDGVLSLRGAYRLDPGAVWVYDVREARERGVVTGDEFLKGVYTDWALETGRELEVLRPAGRTLNELN